jgi:hypothetical protein
VIDGRWLTIRQLQRLHQQAFEEGARTILQMLRTTAEMHDASKTPCPTLDEIADQIEVIMNERTQ